VAYGCAAAALSQRIYVSAARLSLQAGVCFQEQKVIWQRFLAFLKYSKLALRT
jgi:hypothetical protein